MFNIGASELLLIGVVALIFIRPEDLPKLFRSLAKIYLEIKKALKEVTSIKDEFMVEVDRMAKDLDPATPLPADAAGTEKTAHAESPSEPASEAASPAEPASDEPPAYPPTERIRTVPLASFRAGDPESARGYEDQAAGQGGAPAGPPAGA